GPEPAGRGVVGPEPAGRGVVGPEPGSPRRPTPVAEQLVPLGWRTFAEIRPVAGQVPAVPGILTEAEIRATGEAIAAGQEDSGAIGWPDGLVDAWNHVECAMALSVAGLPGPARRAYEWLLATQRPDGSWPRRTAPGGQVSEAVGESNHAAYVAVGVWHEYQVTGDAAFVARMWPAVRRAIEFTLGLQTPRGEIIWQRDPSGVPAGYALLTGCASMHQSLRCAAALADLMGEPEPDWELAAGRLAH